MNLSGIRTEEADQPGGHVPALRLAGLVKRFGETTAVDHVDLSVPRGSFEAGVVGFGSGRAVPGCGGLALG
jgi:ABC-2 type transport system ATP-binding protein